MDRDTESSRNKFLVGITGCLGTGKTFVAEELRQHGAAVIDADKAVHYLYDNDEQLKEQVVSLCGKSILGKDGKIDRRLLGKLLFSDKRRLKAVTDVLWPVVRSYVTQQIDALPKGQNISLVVVEASQLIEAGWHTSFDHIIVMTSPKEAIYARASHRLPQLAREDVDRRLAFQMDLLSKKHALEGHQKVNYTLVENSGTLEELQAYVKRQLVEKLFKNYLHSPKKME